MSWFKKIADAIRGNEDFSDIKSSTLRDVINGNIFTKKFFKKQYAFLALAAQVIVATDEEIAENPRARSAKLRIAEK
jgi:hypothetical protein